jgi:Cu+-exporting ATPase
MKAGGKMPEPYGLRDYSDGSPVFSLDVVCGMKVDEATAPAKTEYAGETYYFCSKHCQDLFENDSARYLGQPKAPSPL